MLNEKFTQKKEALSEKELDAISGGTFKNVAPAPEEGYQCLECKTKFGQNQHQANRDIGVW